MWPWDELATHPGYILLAAHWQPAPAHPWPVTEINRTWMNEYAHLLIQFQLLTGYICEVQSMFTQVVLHTALKSKTICQKETESGSLRYVVMCYTCPGSRRALWGSLPCAVLFFTTFLSFLRHLFFSCHNYFHSLNKLKRNSSILLVFTKHPVVLTADRCTVWHWQRNGLFCEWILENFTLSPKCVCVT